MAGLDLVAVGPLRTDASASLLGTVEGNLARGHFLNAATARYPAVVLGASAATALGIDRADCTVQLWLGNR